MDNANMKYFKVIKGNKFIGILTSDGFRKYQIKHRILLACTEKDGQYAECDGSLYRDNWLAPLNNNIITYELADITEITKEEYDELYEMIERDEEITPDPEPNPDPVPTPDPEDEDVTVAYAKTLKIREMKNTCENLIYAGIDVTLSDEESHHFSLTDHDQLDIFKLEMIARSGEQEFLPYHEDGELCKFYPAQDIIAIADCATNFIMYHTTYFNSLKAYINSLRSLNTVARVVYGMDIPEKYQSDVWKEINKNEES